MNLRDTGARMTPTPTHTHRELFELIPTHSHSHHAYRHYGVPDIFNFLLDHSLGPHTNLTM